MSALAAAVRRNPAAQTPSQRPPSGTGTHSPAAAAPAGAAAARRRLPSDLIQPSIRRALLLRRLSRIEPLVFEKPSQAGRKSRRVVLLTRAGEPLEIPSGWLTARQVSQLLERLGVAQDDYDAMR